jgi:hypothetical protein
MTPNRDAPPSGLPYRLPCILDRKTSFIVIDIVGLAIGQHQPPFLALRLAGKLGGGMAYGPTDARVVARLERTDAALDGRTHRLLER